MVKVVSLSEEAYKTLRGMKGEEESFSELVLRLVRKKGSVSSLFGLAKKDPSFVKGLEKSYKEREKESLRVY